MDKKFPVTDSAVTEKTSPVQSDGKAWPLGERTRMYALAGVIFGFLFPMVGTLVRLIQSQLPPTLSNILAVQAADSLLWIIDTAPLFLGFFAGYAGREQDALLATNQRLQTRERELKDIQTDLGQRAAERNVELETRTNQLRASAYIARQIIELQDVRSLLARVVQLISEQFGYYHVGLFLIDEQRRVAFLQAASSSEGQRMLDRGYSIELEERNLVGRVAERRKFIIVTDPGPSASLIKHDEFPLTRSELVLPLMVRGKALGVLDVHSDAPQAFTSNEAEVLQTLADQVATSIDNVRLLNEARAFVSQLETLTAEQTQMSWHEYMQRRNLAYQYTPAGLRQITPGTSGKSKSALRIPLQLRGREIGTIAVQRKEAADWQGTEQELAEKIATQVALALDNSRLLEDSRRRAVQEQTVSEIAARLSRSLDIDSLLQTAVRELGALPEVAEVSVYIGGQNDKGHKTNVK